MRKNKLISIDDVIELGEVINSNKDFRRNNQITLADFRSSKISKQLFIKHMRN